MGKKVITKQDVERWYFEGIREIYVDKDTILLSGAKDSIAVAGMTVKQCPKEEHSDEQIQEVVEECCEGGGLNESVKREIIKAVIAKYMAKIGGV